MVGVNLSRRTCRHPLASALTRNNNRPATSTFERSTHLASCPERYFLGSTGIPNCAMTAVMWSRHFSTFALYRSESVGLDRFGSVYFLCLTSR